MFAQNTSYQGYDVFMMITVTVHINNSTGNKYEHQLVTVIRLENNWKKFVIILICTTRKSYARRVGGVWEDRRLLTIF